MFRTCKIIVVVILFASSFNPIISLCSRIMKSSKVYNRNLILQVDRQYRRCVSRLFSSSKNEGNNENVYRKVPRPNVEDEGKKLASPYSKVFQDSGSPKISFAATMEESRNKQQNTNEIFVSETKRNMKYSPKSPQSSVVGMDADMMFSSSNQNFQNNYQKSRNSRRTESKDLPFPIEENRNTRMSQIAPSGDMEITFLGTASCVPTVTRGVSSIAFRFNSDVWMVDCGECTQLQLQKSFIKPSRIRKIFITHTHGDHLFGLPGLLCMLGQSTQFDRVNAELEKKKNPEEKEEELLVEIYGPDGIRDYIRSAMQTTYSRITAPYIVHELKNVPYLHSRVLRNFASIPPMTTVSASTFGERPGGRDIYPIENPADGSLYYQIFEDDSVVVRAAPVQHTVPCLGYVITEKDQPGALKIDLVQEIVERNKETLAKDPRVEKGDYRKVFGLLKSLKPHETFTFADGTSVRGEEIVESCKKGRKVVFVGDTCNAELLTDLAKDATVVIHEATNAYFPSSNSTTPSREEYKEVERDAFNHGHSTPQMAGRFARNINAKRLVLTHFSPRYQGDASEYSMRLMWQIEDMAKQTAPKLRGKNDVIAAWDFMRLPIPRV